MCDSGRATSCVTCHGTELAVLDDYQAAAKPLDGPSTGRTPALASETERRMLRQSEVEGGAAIVLGVMV